MCHSRKNVEQKSFCILFKILHKYNSVYVSMLLSLTISRFVYIAHNVNFHPFESTLFNFQRIRYFRHSAAPHSKYMHSLTYSLTFGNLYIFQSYNNKLLLPSLFPNMCHHLSMDKKIEFIMHTQTTTSREF